MSLHPDDLIEDRELAKVDDDRFDHAGIVEQLAALVTTVEMPTNVALYGPWGSGKSGVANLLRVKVDGKNGVRFARFDAFKYAQLPLRRNFISAMATELRRKDEKYHDGLYNGQTRTGVTFPAGAVGKMVGIFILAVVAITLVMAGVIAVIAAIQKGNFSDSFRSLSKAAILASLLPAALLAAFVSMATKTFQVDRSITRPESDEQFEKLFSELVEDSGAKRLVVFIDELDRCAADEVVATLDTVRTFLGIKKCVFIIAADQQVIEEALTRASRQETPTDDTNPYYSTGNAYLDKVFQYQMSLPPLLAQSVSNYASELVKGRQGLWSDIDTNYVLSVLVPTHVASPRRVKHLINTFALAYRLAEQRHRAKLITENPRDSAAAIARMVCLRVEFPLFARHLEAAPNLPDLVLLVLDGHKSGKEVRFPDGTSPRVQELATSYALYHAAPARLLAEGEPTESVADDDLEDEETAEPSDSAGARRIEKAHNKQLLDYLTRTRRVQGPSRDLIFMQSTGTVFGLDGQVALTVERAAENHDVETLVVSVDGMDETGVEAVLRLLSHRIQTGIGIAGPNTARSFLGLLHDRPDLPVGPVIDTVASSICTVFDSDKDVLDTKNIADAWNLVKAEPGPGAADLRRLVIDVATGEGWGHSTDFLLKDAPAALDTASVLVSTHIASVLARPDGTEALDILFGLDDAGLLRTLKAINGLLAHQLRTKSTTHSQWKKNQTAAATASAAAAAATAPAADPEPEPYDPTVLFDALVKHARGRETPIQHAVLHLFLDATHEKGRTAAVALLPSTEPVTDSALAVKVLKATSLRTLGEWPRWLAGVSPTSAGASTREPIEALANKAWSAQADTQTRKAALDALKPFLDTRPDADRPDLTAEVIADTDFEPSTSTQAEALLAAVDKAHLFTTYGLVDEGSFAEAVIESLEDILSSDDTVAEHAPKGPYIQYVTVAGVDALRKYASSMPGENLADIYAKAIACPWLGPVEQVEVALDLADAASATPDALTGWVDREVIATLVFEHPDEATHAASQWVRLSQPGADDLAAIYERLRDNDAVTQEFVNASQASQRTWTTEEHYGFLQRYLSAPEDVPDGLNLAALGLANYDESKVANLLTDRFTAATNNTQRKAVITLWQAAEITETPVRKRLIETVIYGLLDMENDGARLLALSALDDLGDPLPHGVKGALGDRVKSAVEDNGDLANKAEQVLPRLGYAVKTGWFGKPKGVDFEG